MTDRGRSAGAIVAALAAYVALFAVVGYLSWDYLKQHNPGLFYRVNALHLESDVAETMADPVAVLSILAFNSLTFGLAAVVGAAIYPVRWWLPPSVLVAFGSVLWVVRVGPIFIITGLWGAKLAVSFDLACMVACAFVGAWLVTKRVRSNHDAG